MPREQSTEALEWLLGVHNGLERMNASGIADGFQVVGLDDASSSKLIATAAFAESRTFLTFNLRHQSQFDVVMVTFVASFAAIRLSKFDPIVLHLDNSPNMDAVGADNFHMFLDVQLAHCVSPLSSTLIDDL